VSLRFGQFYFISWRILNLALVTQVNIIPLKNTILTRHCTIRQKTATGQFLNSETLLYYFHRDRVLEIGKCFFVRKGGSTYPTHVESVVNLSCQYFLYFMSFWPGSPWDWTENHSGYRLAMVIIFIYKLHVQMLI
jgi:hypothetical protein